MSTSRILSRCANEINNVFASFLNESKLCERYVERFKIYKQNVHNRQLRSMTKWQIAHYFFFSEYLYKHTHTHNAECFEII